MIESRKGVQRLQRNAGRRRDAITRAEIDRLMTTYKEMHASVFGPMKDSVPEQFPEKFRLGKRAFRWLRR